jgi:hypothetical protein
VLANPRCPATAAIVRLAMRLEQGVALAAASPGGGFFSRMSRWFKGE